MNTFDIPCPSCEHPLHVPTGAVLLTRSGTRTTAWVVCRDCGELVDVAVPVVVYATLLKSGGHLVTAPEALPHPEERPEGPALDADDVLALHELLSDDDALADVLRGLHALE